MALKSSRGNASGASRGRETPEYRYFFKPFANSLMTSKSVS
jgi:hypothetical protein